MADKGQTIASLYLSLGVDLSELDEGLALADRSVKDALAKLNSENRQIKIQADIDMAKLEGTGTVLDKIKVKYEAITKQLEIQNQKTLILQRNLEQAQKSGAPDRVQSAAKRRLMEQQLNTAKMEAEQRRLSSILGMSGGGEGTGNALGGLKDLALASKEAGGGVYGLVEGLASLHPTAAAVAAALAMTVGVLCKLKDAMMDAASAQASVYDLGSQIGVTTEEAKKLVAVTSLAAGGGDAYTLHRWLTTLGRQILTAGENGNLVTKTLDKFGVSLKDSEGKIVDEAEALDRLAEGFKKAQAAGRIEEYADGLGMRSQFLLDLMNKMESTYKPTAESLEKKGIFNPEGAAELTDNVAKLEMHVTRLKQSFGAALIPVGNAIVPEITEVIESINGIIYRMANWREYYGIAPDADEVAQREAETAEKAAKRESALAEIRRKEEEQAERQLQEDLNEIKLKYHASAQERELADIEKRKQAELAKEGEVAAERSRIEKKFAAEREEILAKYDKQRREMDTSLKDSILSVTGSDLENALRDIDRKAEELREKYRAAGGTLTDESAGLIDRNAEAQKAKVMENFERDTVSKINDIWRTGLEQRLAAIDRETEAWKKKGVDEAEATKWAEQAKVDAIVNRNRAVMTQEREALNAYLTGGMKGLEAYQMKKDDYIGQLDVQTLNAFDAAKKAVLQKMYGGGLTGSSGEAGGMSSLQAPMQTTADYTKAIYEYVAKGIVTDVKSLPTADLSNAINGSRSAWDSPEIQNYLHDGQTPGVGGGFEDKGAGMEIIRGTQSNLDAATKAMMNAGHDMEIIRGTQSSYDRLSEAGGRDGMAAVNQSLQGILARMDVNRSGPSNDVDITVNIDTAVTEDSASMAKLADAVADRITPKVEQALGGNGYGY